MNKLGRKSTFAWGKLAVKNRTKLKSLKLSKAKSLFYERLHADKIKDGRNPQLWRMYRHLYKDAVRSIFASMRLLILAPSF